MKLSPETKQRLLHAARKAITAAARGDQRPALSAQDWPEEAREECGAFVTLTRKGLLRGCIGLMESVWPLPETVARMAAAAATEDPRFPAARPEEVETLGIEISVLSPLRRVATPEAIHLGQDGVLVKKGARTGVFLPQVARETGWTRERFLNELCASKAGLPENAWQDPNTELYTFQAEIFNDS